MKSSTTKRGLLAYEIMTKPVETVRINDSIHEVVALFTENNISAAAVLDGNKKPVGVITKTDIVRYEKERNGNTTETVEKWMNPVIFNVKRETSLKEIARRMVRYGIHHIFVQGTKDQPIIGVVSSFDVLRQVAAGMRDNLESRSC